MKLDLPKQFITAAIVALITLVSVIAAAQLPPKPLIADLSGEPDVQGSIHVLWYKVPPQNMRHYCLREQDASCSIVIEGVCHIFASDTMDGLMYVGRAFVQCTLEERTTARPFTRTFFPWVDKQQLDVVHYWYARREETIDAVCRVRANACFQYLTKGSILIVIPVPKTITNLATIGHEIKHVVDGLWHSAEGEPYPGVFIHDKKRGE